MKHTNVVIIHGAYGHPNENWFAWLKKELGYLNVQCIVPRLPTPKGQTLHAWMSHFDLSVSSYITSNTILIGHSLGAAFTMRWLETHATKVASVILVGVFIGEVNQPKFDVINSSFFKTSFNWDQIKQQSEEYVCYYGTEDKYVTKEQFNAISKCLNAKKIIVSKAGHFHEATGYTRFPHILNDIKQKLMSYPLGPRRRTASITPSVSSFDSDNDSCIIC